MGMQYDVKAASLSYSGFMVKFRTRVKGISVKGSNTAGSLELFDTVTAPVAGTYGRSGTTVTITSNGHGLQVGNPVGLSFAVSNAASATSGNYVVATANTTAFTVTDINSGTVDAGGNCLFANRWIITLRFADGDVYTNYWLIPGEGILAENGVHATMTTLNAATIFYG